MSLVTEATRTSSRSRLREKPQIPLKRRYMAKKKKLAELQIDLNNITDSIDLFPMGTLPPEAQIVMLGMKAIIESQRKLLDIFGK